MKYCSRRGACTHGRLISRQPRMPKWILSKTFAMSQDESKTSLSLIAGFFRSVHFQLSVPSDQTPRGRPFSRMNT